MEWNRHCSEDRWLTNQFLPGQRMWSRDSLFHILDISRACLLNSIAQAATKTQRMAFTGTFSTSCFPARMTSLASLIFSAGQTWSTSGKVCNSGHEQTSYSGLPTTRSGLANRHDGIYSTGKPIIPSNGSGGTFIGQEPDAQKLIGTSLLAPSLILRRDIYSPARFCTQPAITTDSM